MNLVLLIAAAVASNPAPAAPVQHSGVLRSPDSFGEVLPPDRYQGDGAAIVLFGHQDTIARLCGKPGPDGIGPLACTGTLKDGTPIVVVPNPCIAARAELYAAILCHELGHVNGWPGTHGD